MTVVSLHAARARSIVKTVVQPEALRAIREPGVAAVIWHRRPLDSFQRWIDGLDPDALPSGRVVLRPDHVEAVVSELCDIRGTPPGTERQRLIDDVAALATLFSTVMRTPFLRLRLDVVRTNACKKFHIDAVPARLICTYRGDCTQYGEMAGEVPPTGIKTVPIGSPILLRGTLWPDGSPQTLRHRSPPIEGSGQTRLLLVLDPVFDPAEAA